MCRTVFSIILSLVVTFTAMGQTVRAQHHNVAAGMLALFLEWKKAGANAEMYLYDDGQGPFGPGDGTSTSGAGRDHFYRWMISNGWVTE